MESGNKRKNLATAPRAGLPAEPASAKASVHPSASVDPSAKIGARARIGAFCVIGPDAVIGEECVLYPQSAVFDGATIGRGSVLWPGAVVRERCRIGEDCVLHAHAVVGSDGFGFQPEAAPGESAKTPRAGWVEVGNFVEIGAGTCIDRADTGATVIGDRCRIDNLCQIGRDSRIGRDVIIAGNVGISGHVTVGDGVVIGGGAGIADHVTVGAGAVIAAAAGVMRNVPPGMRVGGIPAREIKQFFREQAAIVRLPDLVRTPRVAAAGQAPAVAPPVKKSFHDWLQELNARSSHKIVIRDFDGLDRADFARSYREVSMTEKEFQQKLARCTFNIKT